MERDVACSIVDKMKRTRSQHRRRCKQRQKRDRTVQLLSKRYTDPCQHWRDLDGYTQRKVPNITLDSYTAHFMATIHPDDESSCLPDHDTATYIDSDMKDEIIYEELEQPISERELTKSIRLLKSGTSAGVDLYINELLKHA